MLIFVDISPKNRLPLMQGGEPLSTASGGNIERGKVNRSMTTVLVQPTLHCVTAMQTLLLVPGRAAVLQLIHVASL